MRSRHAKNASCHHLQRLARGVRAGVAFWLLSCATAAVAQPPPLPPPPVPPQNPITEPKRVLGKLLFWEEQLSSDDTVACGTCHQPGRGGADRRFAVHPGPDGQFQTPDDIFGSFGVVRRGPDGQPLNDPIFGFNRQVTPRAAQNMLQALWAPSLFWDGRAGPAFINPQTGQVSIPQGGGLEAQSVGPILNTVEMAHDGRTWNDVIAKLQSVIPMALATNLPPDMAAALGANPTYPQLFAAAFGDPAITAERIAFALATYERTLVPNQTPFDLGTLTPLQQQGLNVFLAPQSQCTGCHTPPLLTGNGFRNIGLRPIAEDIGRQAVTGNPADAGRFKVPGLRNVGLKRTFMHNGRKGSLEQVIDFYLGINGQIQFPQNQDPLIPQIAIPPQARPPLIEFLRNGLTDPRVAAETFPFDRPRLRSEQVGDVDGDGDVDQSDLGALLSAFGSCDGDAAYDARADFDQSGCVDQSDLGQLLSNFGT
jgi:cytochrome c peroxidase